MTKKIENQQYRLACSVRKGSMFSDESCVVIRGINGNGGSFFVPSAKTTEDSVIVTGSYRDGGFLADIPTAENNDFILVRKEDVVLIKEQS